MNIKTLANNTVTPLDRTKSPDKSREVKSEESHDRDANGRRESDGHPEKQHLSEEEVQLVLESLKKIPGVTEHNLIPKVKFINNSHFFSIEDLSGKVIRRMNTSQAWHVHLSQDQKTGQLLNKTS